MKTMKPKPVKFIDGYSESLWKSLAVKALRIGWPAGIEAAARRLAPSTMESLLLCGVFEDVFPTRADLPDVHAAIKRRDYRQLCTWETHHGRSYTDKFCDLEKEAVEAAQNRKEFIWGQARPFHIWLPPRSLNCFYTWLKIAPASGGTRPVDEAPFTDMPAAMADAHTWEGKQVKTSVTLLSGHYHNHRALGARVMAEGWDRIREEVHATHFPRRKDPQQLLPFTLDGGGFAG